MPSWNEKPHTKPLININLRLCDCGYIEDASAAQRAHASGPCVIESFLVRHLDRCASAPVIIHCRIPRSVTFTVAAGGCTCGADAYNTRKSSERASFVQAKHCGDCRARPIRVACSIGGKTWEESEVDDLETHNAPPDAVHATEGLDVLQVARERWALVKALVAGQHGDAVKVVRSSQSISWSVLGPMLQQRDAVFSALAEQARLEVAMLSAQDRTVKAIGSPRLTASAREPNERPSAQALSIYVEQLIEQVGVLQ